MSDIEKRAEIALCPFCGDWGAEVAESAVPSIHGGQKQAVYCNTCFCEGPTSETEKGAVEAWNRRAALTPPEGYVLAEASKAADSARLDFLDAMNVALNCHYGTNYGWRLILSGQITRLMSGQQKHGFVGDIDLNDQNAGRTGFPGCRQAIDAARPEVSGG